jgi:transposase
MKSFVIGSDFTVIDLTHIFSLSENVISSTLGHNSEKEYTPQVNLTLLFSLDKKHPVFFRIVPGSIRDVSTIPLTLREAGVEKAVVIGDKGFTSRSNTGFLEEQHLEYILPMKRNDSNTDYSPLKQADRRGFNGYFFFESRCIWFYEKKQEKNRTILFLDEKLKTEEEKDFLTHVDNKKLTMEEYYKKQHTLGTITVGTNTPFTPQKVYELLKSRVEIEIVFDTLKNTLHADRTYMRDDKHLEGWMFINFIALLIYYRIYNLLTDKNLLSKYSPKDIIQHLSRVHKVKIGEKWHTSEIPKTTRNLIEKMQINLPVT